MYKTPNNLSSERVNGGQRIELQRGVITGQHSTLERAAGDKYIDGARPLERGTFAKRTTQNKDMTRVPTKNPQIQREEQRHNPLLLFPLEGEWLMRGRGIPSTVKARDKIATLMPLGGENCDLNGAQPEGWVFHPSLPDRTLTISTHGRFELPSARNRSLDPTTSEKAHPSNTLTAAALYSL